MSIENEPIHLEMKRKKVLSMILLFMDHARYDFYKKYQEKFLDHDFIDGISFIENNRSILEEELSVLDITMLDRIEQLHTNIMTEMGMRFDDIPFSWTEQS